MDRRLAIGLLIFGLATGVAAADELKVGYVDFERVALNSPQIAEGKARLDEEFRPRNEALEIEEQRLQDMEDRLLRDAAVMTEAQEQAMERELRALRRQVQRDREDLVDEFNFRLNEVQQEVEKEIEEIVRRFADDNNFDLILVTHVLYVSERIDITDQVIEILRRENASESAQ